MDTHETTSFHPRAKFSKGFGILALSAFGSVQAIDLVDDFDGTELDLTVWESTGGKTNSIIAGALVFADDGGDWATGDISTADRFLIPEAGETTEIIWTLGTASVTTPNPENRVVRYQIGIHSANETASRKEHWHNTTGGLWIDLDVFDATFTDTVSGNAFYTDDTKAAQSQATTLGGVTLDWNWQTENRVLKLTLTETEYSWFDGDNLLLTDTYANANIDTEFANGFRVLALGMNFSSGRGTSSYEKIEILNAREPSALLSNFESSRAQPFGGQTFTLDWLVSSNATVTIDQEIGNVDDITTDGTGQITITAPIVTEPTTIDYKITASANGETLEQTVSVEVVPTLPLSTESFVEEFEGDFLNEEMWTKTGDQSFEVTDGKLEWAADGSNWSHGEIETREIYPIPTGTNTTTVTWVYGPNTVTASAESGNALRPLMGIFSGYEDETYSKQHWQNNEGGIWLDLPNMGNDRPDGVSGNIHIANDTKARETNAETVVGVDISPWNWQTENQEFSLVLTETGFTWFAGENEIGGALYADYGIDTEFEAGFGIMAMAGNTDTGRGEMSFESISIDNGGAVAALEIKVTNIDYDPANTTLSLTWTSRENSTYSIQFLTADGEWELELDEVEATGELTTENLTNIPATSGIYRVIEEE